MRIYGIKRRLREVGDLFATTVIIASIIICVVAALLVQLCLWPFAYAHGRISQSLKN